MDYQIPAITVLAVDDCVNKQCPAFLAVGGPDGQKAVIGKVVTDPQVAEALGEYIGPGEAVVLISDSVLRKIKEG